MSCELRLDAKNKVLMSNNQNQPPNGGTPRPSESAGSSRATAVRDSEPDSDLIRSVEPESPVLNDVDAPPAQASSADDQVGGAVSSDGHSADAQSSDKSPSEYEPLDDVGLEPVIESHAHAPLLIRATAIAVDLCLAVAVASAACALISLLTPLDTAAAKLPMLVVVVAVVVYLAWGRNRYPSIGRSLHGLMLFRPTGPIAGIRGRPITVYIDAIPNAGNRPLELSILVIVGGSVLAALALAQSLASTQVFQLVEAHAQTAQPFQARYGAPIELSPLPRALLIGKQRAYAQVSAKWGEKQALLDFFLKREGRAWRIEQVSEGLPGRFANYALATPDDEVPSPGPKPKP